MNNIFSTKISKDQARDTGMAVVLILLLISVFIQHLVYVKIAIGALILTMTFPIFYKYIAVIWLGISHLLGTFVSKILLTLVFFIVVTPVGLFRRIMGYDTMKLKEFRKKQDSVMQIRNITFTKNNIDKPF